MGNVCRVNNVNELVDILKSNGGDVPCDFFISLIGNGRSSKSIQLLDDDTLSVWNEIDDTEDIIKLNNLNTTNLGLAMSKGNFYKY